MEVKIAVKKFEKNSALPWHFIQSQVHSKVVNLDILDPFSQTHIDLVKNIYCV